MLGHSHALSGLAAGAATLPWAPAHGTVAQIPWGAGVGGFPMLPALARSGSTVPEMWGRVTDVPSGAIGRFAQGHRWGTHDAILGPAAFGGLAYLAADAFWSSLLLLALSIGLALRALNFVIPGRAENTVVGNLILSWGGAWLLLSHSPSPGWLPWAVALGCLTHIAGDAITTAGIPVPLLWIFHRARLKLLPIRTGNVIEKGVLVPLFLATAVCLLYVNTEAHTALDPLVARILSLG